MNNFFILFFKCTTGNKCIGDTTVYQFNAVQPLPDKRKNSVVKVGVYLGVNFTNISFDGSEALYPYLTSPEFNNSIKPAFGLLLNVEPLRARGKWAIIFDVLVRSYLTTAEYTSVRNENWYINYDVKLSGTDLTFNPMWRYYFGKNKLKPYLNIGFYLANNLVLKTKMNAEEYYYGTVTNSNPNIFSGEYISFFDYGLTVGGGLRYQKFSFDLRYTYGGTKVYPINSNTQTFYLMLGYVFN